MKLSDFEIGTEFVCGRRRWRTTDVGLRVVVAIGLDASRDPSWLVGPPYAVLECVFDEDSILDCVQVEVDGVDAMSSS